MYNTKTIIYDMPLWYMNTIFLPHNVQEPLVAALAKLLGFDSELISIVSKTLRGARRRLLVDNTDVTVKVWKHVHACVVNDIYIYKRESAC
jgi:hypothetical protein